MHLKTKAIHAGMRTDPQTGAIITPLYRSTIYEHGSEGMHDTPYHYTRDRNPNREQLEELLAGLEEGEACAAFSSGVAATHAVLQALQPGDHVLAPEDVYHGTRHIMKDLMQSWGLTFDFVDMRDTIRVRDAIRPQTRLIWLETPSNPMLHITDLSSIAEQASQQNIVVCVDNTWPTPVNQRPLSLGADLVVHSTTKYLGGHSDLLGGAVVSKEQSALFERVAEIQSMAGAVPSPDDCWQLVRSIRTLPWRMQGHNENAMRLARFLQHHPRVTAVYYPGLSDHEGHRVAGRQMEGFGGVISFTIDGGRREALDVVNRARLIKRATSLGGVESTWEHRRSSEGEDAPTPDNLIRLSVGLEHPEDLENELRYCMQQ